MTTSTGVMQQIAARTAPIAPVVMRVWSRITNSASRCGREPRLRGGMGECGDVGPAIVVCHHCRLVLVGDDRLAHARYGFEAFANNEWAVGAVHVLDGQRDGFFRRQGGGGGG